LPLSEPDCRFLSLNAALLALLPLS
jgi:hypothetical protein